MKIYSSCIFKYSKHTMTIFEVIAFLVFYCKTHCQEIAIKACHDEFCNKIIANFILNENSAFHNNQWSDIDKPYAKCI